MTAILAYFSNSFSLALPYAINESPFAYLQYSPTDLVLANVAVLVCQHLGILIGAIVFSFWVDKKDRLFILLISVFTYSFGTFLGGFVSNYYLFLVLRFVVGFGLAPEMGIGIVLICEIFSRKESSFLVAISAIVGFSALIVLTFSGQFFFWRDIYFSVGICGLLIMILRFASFDSDIFTKIKKENFHINPIKSTLKSLNFLLLLLCMLPVFVIIASSTFIVQELVQVHHIILTKKVLLIYFTTSAMVGFLLMPILSRFLKSRVQVSTICISLLMINAILTYFYITYFEIKSSLIYIVIISKGFFCGYLFEFYIYAIEQFGTNRRGSATTLLFALGRSSVFIFTLLIQFVNNQIYQNLLNTLITIQMPVFLIAIWAVLNLKETYNKDLDFID